MVISGTRQTSTGQVQRPDVFRATICCALFARQQREMKIRRLCRIESSSRGGCDSVRSMSTTSQPQAGFGLAPTKGQPPRTTRTSRNDDTSRARPALTNEDTNRFRHSPPRTRANTRTPVPSKYAMPELFGRPTESGVDRQYRDNDPKVRILDWPRSTPRPASSSTPTPLKPMPDFSSLPPLPTLEPKVSYPLVSASMDRRLR